MKHLHSIGILFFPFLAAGCSWQAGSEPIPAPRPVQVDPGEHSSEAPVPVVITGSNFITKVTRQLNGKNKYSIDDTFVLQLQLDGYKTWTLEDTNYVDSETLRSIVPQGIPEGTYTLVVTTPYDLTGSLEQAYTVIPADGDTDTETATETHPDTDTDTDSETATDTHSDTDSETDGESCGGTAIWCQRDVKHSMYSEWDSISFATTNPTSEAGTWRIMAGAASPFRDEKIVVGIDAGNKISGIRWDGNAWNNLPFNPLDSVTVSYYWAFAVAYEQKTGNCLLVWNKGEKSNPNLAYREWNGSAWSEESSIPMSDSEEPRHMIMASNPHSDEMVLVVNKNGADVALVWNGSAWGNILPLDDSSGDTDIFVAYEQVSGRAMVVFGKNGDENGYYRIWNGSEWSVEAPISPPTGVTAPLRWSTLASDPTSNRLAFGGITSSLSDKSNIWLIIWNGTSWIDPKIATSSQTSNVNYPNVALAFESLTGRVVATYEENLSATGINYHTWSETEHWSKQIAGPEITDNGNSTMLYPNPFSDNVALLVQNSTRKLHFSIWNGASWSAPILLESDTGEIKNQPFLFLWNRHCP